MVFKKLFKILKRAFLHKKRRPKHKLKYKPKTKFKRKLKPKLKSRLKPRRKFKPKSKRKSKVKPKSKLRHRVTKQPPVIGVVTHYFPKVNAAVVKLKKPLKIGEPIWIKGKLTDFRQTAGSMQIDRKPIESARAGQEIGLQVFRDVRPGDFVFVSVK